MERIKYKCLDCGHKFDGDLSTDVCPNCQSFNIKPDGDGISPLVWKVLGVVAGIVIAVFIIKAFSHSDSITADFDVVDNEIRIKINDVPEKELKSKYAIVMTNDSDTLKTRYVFNGRSNTKTISPKSDDYKFIGGVTYTFSFVEKRSNETPKDFRWNGTPSYTHPLPPVAPEIKVSKVADCNNNTYTVTISVVKGYADRFFLNEKEQTDSVFYEVKPQNEKYKIKVYDSANRLSSEITELICKPVHRFQITSETIDKILEDISKRNIQTGTALERINNNSDIRLAKPIDNNSTLEAALEYAYNQKVRYKAQVEIEHHDCNDKIVKITLSR